MNFVGRIIWTFCSGGEKRRNASGQQGEKEQQWIKREPEFKQQNFLWAHLTISP